ncbi:putative glycosyltransferase EpsE [Abditibacteriota bacterium]|nr:putative glycosyltransferase EpsE [Abditibacteriota bacterium]
MENAKKPRVTVIIATYNWSEVLSTSVGSVARQSFRDFELLVVGDACTDDSAEVMERLIAQYSECDIRWVNCPQNAGSQYGPNNEGLRQARGEYIAYLGHDDLWLPHHLEVLVEALDVGADVAHSVVAWVTPEGEAMQPHPIDLGTVPSSVMHRVEVSRHLDGWRSFRDIKLTVDVDFFGRARKAGFRFVFVPRLSVVKFPANVRRDVYKIRGNREQSHWFERIGSEPDFEAVELCKMLRISTHQQHRPPVRLWLETTVLIIRKLGDRFRYYGRCLRFGPKGAHTQATREFKGLSRKS